jgi:hypothetical protein
MADTKKPRYRVTDTRAYILFDGDTRVDAGNLVPKDVEVEDWLIEREWVVEV